MSTSRHYWLWRTDRRSKDYFWNEIKAGRVRQGWGWDPSQDLRLVIPKWGAGEDLDKLESAVKGQWWMADGPEHEGYMQPGDIVLLANLPGSGLAAIAEITGGYNFDIDPEQGDFGHYRPAKLLTPDGFNPSSTASSASIRKALRFPRRMKNIDYAKGELERVVELAQSGSVVLERTSPKERLNTAISELTPDIRGKIRGVTRNALRAEEWEEPVAAALQSIFPWANVEKTGGPNEQGADIVVDLPSGPFSERPFRILVQFKDYSGETGIHALEQVLKGKDAWSDTGEILAYVLMTNGEISDELEAYRQAAEYTVGARVIIVTGDTISDLLLLGSLNPFGPPITS